MEFFKIKRDIPFMRYSRILNVISMVTFLVAVFALIGKGLHFSIEFTGGTVVEINFEQSVDTKQVRDVMSTLSFQDAQVQFYGSTRDILIRLPLRDAKVTTEALPKLQNALESAIGKLQIKRVEFVGPQVGGELAKNGLIALLFVIGGIVIYLSFRFEWKFAVAAIIANLHDVIIILGFFAMFRWEFSLPVLAAVLAVLGYSVNESVVIFDRIREYFYRERKLAVAQIIDRAITSTMSRTIITHGSTQIMVLSMLIFGGETLYFFALALTIGILFGIYSSVFVAASITLWLGVKREDLISSKQKSQRGDRNDPNAGAVV